MSKAQEIGQKVQGQTLDAVRKTQDAVVEAVTAWTETADKIPGYARFTKQFPAATEVIDSNFDFAQQILTSQRDFAARIVAATAPNAPRHRAEGDRAEGHRAEGVRAEGGQEDRARRGKEECSRNRSPQRRNRQRFSLGLGGVRTVDQ